MKYKKVSLLKQAIGKLWKKSRDIAEVNRNRAEIVSRLKDAAGKKRKGRIGEGDFAELLRKKHLGYTKREWLGKCDNFVLRTRDRIREDLNSLIENRFPSSTGINIFMIALILAFGLYFFSPALTGFFALEEHTAGINTEFSSSANLSLEMQDIEYFMLEGFVSRGFIGKVYLSSESEKYRIIDYSVGNLSEDVEGSSLRLEILAERISDDVVRLNADTGLSASDPVCVKWSIGRNEICYGDEKCCLLLELPSSEKSWNSTLYLNKGRFDAVDRNIVKAQAWFANYSLDISNAYSDIRYSDIKGMAVDLFSSLDFSTCGQACNIDSQDREYRLEIDVAEGSIFISNYSYAERAAPNRAPAFSDVPDITFAGNYTVDMSGYASDPDGDSLHFSYYEAEGINITFEGSKAFIKAADGFTGKAYTFFKANDSNLRTVSNIVEIKVVERAENVSSSRVVIGRPVKWTKKAAVVSGRVQLEHSPINVSVKKNGKEIDDSRIDIVLNRTVKDLDEYEEEREMQLLEEKIRKAREKGIDASGLEERRNAKRGEIVVSRAGRILRKLVSAEITGNAVLGSDDETALLIDKSEADDGDEIEVEYYTEGPTADEENISNGKRVMISSDIGYRDVLAYAFIPDTAASRIRLYHITGGKRIGVSFDGYDSNNDGLVDYIEWNVPHMSTQTYEIIYITKAEHLDSDREFIADIYGYVREKDNNWSGAINDSEYARVTFEKELDNTKDITIYARANSGNASVEVYRKGGNESIALFESISSEGWYKVYLANLSDNESIDIFDLKIACPGLNCGVEFDYIVDPTTVISAIDIISDSLLSNITADGNFTHLNISDTGPYDKLVAYWNFDGDKANTKLTTHYDFTGNNNDGTGVGDALTNSTNCLAHYGNCLQLDGNDYVSMSNPNWNFPNITISMWVRPEPSASGIEHIFGQNYDELLFRIRYDQDN
ncbi:hypothetical protein GF323_03005, partial [Candidatus Woesearchaeota archaeon]|nr:hypothetical protein [Candidatus Woesearchaeota archaeon]